MKFSEKGKSTEIESRPVVAESGGGKCDWLHVGIKDNRDLWVVQ